MTLRERDGGGQSAGSARFVSPQRHRIMKGMAIAPQPDYLHPSGLLIGRPPVKTTWPNGRVVRAVGESRVYPDLPPQMTFHEFVLQVFIDLVGKEWLKTEKAKPQDQQHVISRWLEAWTTARESGDFKVEDEVLDIRSAEPTGDVLSLLVLAYDAYVLMHCGMLHQRLIDRLKTGFQGARYEMAVAALFARAGFQITWITESQTEKRPEFTAHHPLTGDTVIVEAKSRGRAGAFDRADRSKAGKVKADITGLVADARKKRTRGLPYFIFIEMNQPPTPETPVFEKEWVTDLQRRIGSQPNPTTETPDDYAVLAVTNFSWHYLKEKSVGGTPGEEVKIISLHPNAPVKNPKTLDLVQDALSQYGQVPPWL